MLCLDFRYHVPNRTPRWTRGCVLSGTTPHLAKVWLEDGWGDRCRWPGQIPVLLALPYNRNMEPRLLQLMFRWPSRPSACHRRRAMHVAAAGPEPAGLVWRSGVKAMECSNTGFELKLALYDKPFNNSMDAKKTKVSGRTVLAMIRNILVHDYLKPEHEFILWMDAGASPAPARRRNGASGAASTPHRLRPAG